jgi:predicted RNase H-like nuclease
MPAWFASVLPALLGLLGVLVGSLVPLYLMRTTRGKIVADIEAQKATATKTITEAAEGIVRQLVERVRILESEAATMSLELGSMRVKIREQDSAMWRQECTIREQEAKLREQDGRVVALTCENVELRKQMATMQELMLLSGKANG